MFRGHKHTVEAKEKNRQAHLGIRPSPESIRKRVAKMRGFKQTEYQKRTVAEALSKTWQVTDPHGQTQIITNLLRFCREHKLDQGNMMKVVNGIMSHSKGWLCRRA